MDNSLVENERKARLEGMSGQLKSFKKRWKGTKPLPASTDKKSEAERRKKAAEHRTNQRMAAGSYVRSLEQKQTQGKKAADDRRRDAKKSADRINKNPNDGARSLRDTEAGEYASKNTKPTDLSKGWQDQARFNKEYTKNKSKGSTQMNRNLRAAAARRSGASSEKRIERIKSGDYKGKYLGPDAFKGNEAKIAEWKAAGKPDISTFLKKK